MRQPSLSAAREGAWGALAGLVGSLCCIGPSAAVLLGLGSSSALAGITFDRGLVLAGGGALLAAGLALALRPARECAVRGMARWRGPALMLATFALAYALIGLALPAVAARQVESSAIAAAPAPSSAAAAPMRRATLIIEKMVCPPCAGHVSNALKRNPAVRAFVAESLNEQVTIDYDSSRTSARELARRFPPTYGVTLLSDVALP